MSKAPNSDVTQALGAQVDMGLGLVPKREGIKMTTYFEMIDAVNDAKTEHDRGYAEARLSGWIACAEAHGVRWSGIDADIYTMAKHGDKPMCCGVLERPNDAGKQDGTVRRDGSA